MWWWGVYFFWLTILLLALARGYPALFFVEDDGDCAWHNVDAPLVTCGCVPTTPPTDETNAPPTAGDSIMGETSGAP
eukprot:CAMPEP_0196193586 /NCGR_PEP_ID=MMETSP0911-20130528/49619_1 /TAXON_ID=49265 /ORGANISM="Thalassiosira rotula, Strain GSO102" /LENGTH=76 /DNA_ID=CAMNT_0041465827 /DNA_START=759 /DNA_END=985 /DNA_ORIENTATION=+